MFARGFFPGFTLPGMSVDLLGGPYLLLKDIIQLVVLGAIGMALYRWSSIRPACSATHRLKNACANRRTGRRC